IEFGFEQISEIAVRALSPGINDPYTARQALHLLGELILFIEDYDIEQDTLRMDNQIVGTYRSLTYKGLVDSGLDRLREASIDDPTVTLAFYDTIIQLTSLLKEKRIICALLMQ